MELLYFIVGLIALYILWQIVELIIFKIRYPVYSDTPPMGILGYRDEVIVNGKECIYVGIDNKDGNVYYVFQSQINISEYRYTVFQTLKGLKQVKGRFGYKWRRTSSSLKRFNYLEEIKDDGIEFNVE